MSVYKKLSQHNNIVGVKEAATDIKKILQIKAKCPPDFSVWSGNDDMTVPVISLGGVGVISCLSNIYPAETQAMTIAALAVEFDTASSLQINMYPLIDLLFHEVNPIPVKTAMKLIGFDCGTCRMPLTSASENLKNQLKQILAT